MSVALPLILHDGDRARLEELAGSGSVGSDLVLRARILLLAADGLANAEVARRTATSRSTVEDWRARYAGGGISALTDLPRSGRPVKVDEIEVVVTTLADDGSPPARLGARHWSARLLGAELGIPFTTVARIWRKWNIQPSDVASFKFATDPELDARIAEVVGVHLGPTVNAVVVRIDENSPTKALDPGAPIPMPGLPASRKGQQQRSDETAALFAAIEVVAGHMSDSDGESRSDDEFLAFLDQVAEAHPGFEMHVVAAGRAGGRHPAPNDRSAGNVGITVHFASTAGSWLQLVKVLFAIVGRRGTSDSVAELSESIAAFIDDRHDSGRPFVWVKDPGPVLTEEVVERSPEPAASGPERNWRTDELLAVAFEAVHARLEALETATGRVRAAPAAVTELTAAIQALRARLGTVESASGGPRPSPRADTASTEPGQAAAVREISRDEVLSKHGWLLARLGRNTGPAYTRGDVGGSIAFGGVLRAPGSGPVRWQAEYAVPDIMAAHPPSAAAVLAAMGHPLRLQLLWRMVLGASMVGEFQQQVDGIGTTNQVHHHLRELRPAGLVVSAKRNQYAIPTDRVVPILVIVGAALGRRVIGSAGLRPVVETAPDGTDPVQDTDYWMLDHLDRNTGPAYTQGQLSGSIALGGIMHAPGSGRCAWRSEYTVPDVMAADLPSAALILAALGHALRLELLRRMLLGASTVAELQQIDGIGSPGQVHHHLRELRAAGLVVSARRNHYAVPGDRVVHLLVIIGAALGRRVIGRAG